MRQPVPFNRNSSTRGQVLRRVLLEGRRSENAPSCRDALRGRDLSFRAFDIAGHGSPPSSPACASVYSPSSQLVAPASLSSPPPPAASPTIPPRRLASPTCSTLTRCRTRMAGRDWLLQSQTAIDDPSLAGKHLQEGALGLVWPLVTGTEGRHWKPIGCYGRGTASEGPCSWSFRAGPSPSKPSRANRIPLHNGRPGQP